MIDYHTDCDTEDDDDFEIISSDDNELQLDENNY